MGASFLAHAEEAHLKWNSTKWTRAHHLLGTLCLEERREMFASELLVLLGHGPELDAALNALQRERSVPANAVDEELLVKLRAAHADGSLARTMRVWGLNGDAITSELLLLASMPARVTEVNPELCATDTPLIFNAFKGMLFVVMTHNLTLESYVSDLANLEKIHTHTHAITLHYMFMYKKHQTESRLLRLAPEPELRSVKGGGSRAAAQMQSAIGKRRKGSANHSKPQQLHLCMQVRASAATYCTAALYVRGRMNIRRRLHEQRRQHDVVARNVAACSVAHRRATCKASSSGRARVARTAIACKRLIYGRHTAASTAWRQKGAEAACKCLEGQRKGEGSEGSREGGEGGGKGCQGRAGNGAEAGTDAWHIQAGEAGIVQGGGQAPSAACQAAQQQGASSGGRESSTGGGGSARE